MITPHATTTLTPTVVVPVDAALRLPSIAMCLAAGLVLATCAAPGAAHEPREAAGEVVSGLVVDEAGVPVAGARVASTAGGAAAVADASGVFRYARSGCCFAPEMLAASAGGNWGAISLPFAEPPRQCSVVIRVAGAWVLSGRVETARGDGIGGALVYVALRVVRGKYGPDGTWWSGAPRATTSDDGAFAIAFGPRAAGDRVIHMQNNVVVGHGIAALAPGWAPAILCPPEWRQRGPGDVTAQLTLAPGRAVRGTVADAASKAAVGGAVVALGVRYGLTRPWPPSEGPAQAPTHRALTGPDGSFVLDGVPLGAAIISVEARGYQLSVIAVDAGQHAGALRVELTSE